MNGLTVFQIKVHNKYSAEDFDEDLRQVLRRSGGEEKYMHDSMQCCQIFKGFLAIYLLKVRPIC